MEEKQPISFEPLSIDEILEQAVLEHKANPRYRKGQAFFNILCDYYPQLAEEIRGTDKDCFYEQNVPDELITYLKEKI